MEFVSIILAGGFGTRLKGAIGENAKGFIKLAKGNTLISKMAEDLKQTQGISNFALVANAKHAADYKSWFKSIHPGFKVKVLNNGALESEQRLGAIGDLMFALNKLKWWNKNVIVLPSDTYYEFPLDRLVKLSQKHKGFITVVRKFKNKIDIAGKLGCAVLKKETNSLGEIMKFIEKPLDPPTSYGAVPFYVYPKNILKLLPIYKKEGGDLDAPGSVIPWLIKKGKPVYAMIVKETTKDFGRPEDLEK